MPSPSRPLTDQLWSPGCKKKTGSLREQDANFCHQPRRKANKKKKTSRKHPLFKCFALYSRRRSDVLLDLHQCNPFPPVALCYIMADQPGGRPSGRVASLVLQSGYISRRLDTQICHWQGGRDGHSASPPPPYAQPTPHPSPPSVWSSVIRLAVRAAC